MNNFETGLFLLAALALFGSPGPAIVALVAVSRKEGGRRGLGFFCGLQFGLAIASGLSIVGLFTILEAVPGALLAMTVASSAYLLFLAYRIAFAPIAHSNAQSSPASSPMAGMLLSLFNPKAYAAFLSLFASFVLMEGDVGQDNLLKWALCVFVNVVVDLIWLWIGVSLGKAKLSAASERALNLTMGAAIVLAIPLSHLN